MGMELELQEEAVLEASSNDHVITIPEMDNDEEDNDERKCLLSMEAKTMNWKPLLLKESAGSEVCCIFRVPRSLRKVNDSAHQPFILSVGPYHHGKKQVKMMEEHKWKYLRALLSRSEVQLKTFFNAIASSEEQIRKCYSEEIKLNRCRLIKMMVLDGCFIIELLCRSMKLVRREDDDPIFKMPWVIPYIMRDLLRLENQMPFFVLQTLHKLSKVPPGSGDIPTFTALALKFFNKALGRDEEVLKKYHLFEGKHLLDLFCLSFIPLSKPKAKDGCRCFQICSCNNKLLGLLSSKPKEADQQRKKDEAKPRDTSSWCFFTKKVQSSKTHKKGLIYSAQKLHQAGIKIQSRETDILLSIRFCNGVLEIPHLTIDDFTSSFVLNAIAFEQCYSYRPDLFTSYAYFMGCLINTTEDVGFLRSHKIMENYLGTDEEVVFFFNDLRKDVVFDIKKCYLLSVFEGVERYRMLKRAKIRVYSAELWGKYFGSPWSILACLGALAGLVLTAIQAYYAVHPKN